MKLAIDESIWEGRDLFAPLGEVSTFSGRCVLLNQIAEADALIVRSVTRVDERLLGDSRVRFVGTASSGTDHVDTAFLAKRGIEFADAAGCNSRTVAEYVLAALLLLSQRENFELAGKVLGVVGVGRIGSIVAKWAQSLGMRVLLCDPPLERAGVGGPYVSAHQIADEADVMTLHVPLVREGPDATLEMVNDAWLAKVKRRPVFINTSRGEVVHEEALLAAVAAGHLGPIVLDVWNGEPAINPRLLKAASIATPHIAGYSQEARKRAARMIRDRLAEFQRRSLRDDGPDTSSPSVLEPDADGSPISNDPSKQTTRIVLKATGLAAVDRALRERSGRGDGASAFDDLRRVCSQRREFPSCVLRVSAWDEGSKTLLLQWGFQIA